MEPTAELKQAVKKYREGKSEAFIQLYEESSKYIYTCIYKVMGGNDNVQDTVCDIMQDTYVEISRSIRQLDSENSFLSWAGTIATRKCYAWLKKNKKYVLLNEEDDTFENLADDDNIIPEEVMQDREKQRLVREIIDTQLTEMQRLCIIAFYYNEQKQSEIAKELGIPENTVKTNLSRAKAKIKAGVLDLEKKQGTRLYSAAPILLLLFKEDVFACTVPASVTTAVSSSVLGTGKIGTKHLLAKIAGASAKAKMTAGIVGIGILGAITGSIYIARQPEEQPIMEESMQESIDRGEVLSDITQAESIQTDAEESGENEVDIITRLQGDTWEKYYARALLSPETKYVAFDLHDFDEDGMPELVAEMKDGSLDIRSFYDIVSITYLTADSVGYGDTMSELININYIVTNDGIDLTSVYVYDKTDGFELIEAIEPTSLINNNNYTYDVVDGDYNREVVSYEEGMQRIQEWEEKYQKIDFKPLDQDIVIEFIEANSQNGKLLDD